MTITLSAAERERMHADYLHLHQTPELSMQEHETANWLAARLDELGIDNFRCGGTGVVGILRNGEGPVLGFRADTDALPIAEDTGLDYASTATGTLDDGTIVPVMHGCGHDTHMTALLTAVRWLDSNRERWAGTLVILFQPGEETAAGARAMIEDGLWDRAPKPEIIIGQHVMPLQAGMIALSTGTAMSMSDALRVTVFGTQSHGSQPQSSIDPIVLAAHTVTRLQTIVSREIDPADPAVVTIGTFHAGLKENIIPDRAEFTVNVRTFRPEVRAAVLAAIRRIISAEAAASAAPEPLVEEIYHFPLCYNEPAAAEEIRAALEAELGADKVLNVPASMGSEDFGALAAAIEVPSVYWFFGGFELGEGVVPPVNHSPFFGPVMEPTLTTGTRAALAGILARLAA